MGTQLAILAFTFALSAPQAESGDGGGFWTTEQLEQRVLDELLVEGISLSRLREELHIDQLQESGWVVSLTGDDKKPRRRVVENLSSTLDAVVAEVVPIVMGLLERPGGRTERETASRRVESAKSEERSSGPNSAHGSAGFFQQWNRFEASGAKISVGYDRFLADFFTLGLRGGLLAGENASPFLGGRAIFWIGDRLDRVQGAVGAGLDFWINTGSSISSPVFLYVGAEAGLRVNLDNGWFVGVPLEIGLLPYFSPEVFAFHLGVQAGTSF